MSDDRNKNVANPQLNPHRGKAEQAKLSDYNSGTFANCLECLILDCPGHLYPSGTSSIYCQISLSDDVYNLSVLSSNHLWKSLYLEHVQKCILEQFKKKTDVFWVFLLFIIIILEKEE